MKTLPSLSLPHVEKLLLSARENEVALRHSLEAATLRVRKLEDIRASVILLERSKADREVRTSFACTSLPYEASEILPGVVYELTTFQVGKLHEGGTASFFKWIRDDSSSLFNVVFTKSLTKKKDLRTDDATVYRRFTFEELQRCLTEAFEWSRGMTRKASTAMATKNSLGKLTRRQLAEQAFEHLPF